MAKYEIDKPDVSVLMPVYNAALTLKPAIWSILNQSFSNFEFVIYLDGCSDDSESIVKSFSDPRIRMIISEENKGIVHARNTLVSEAKGNFIAWLDSDDIAIPGRLAYQFDFMEVHPNLMVLGSWVEVRNSRHITKTKWPVSNDILQAWSFFRNPFVQSSLMIRNKKGLIHYDSEFEYLEDYDLLSRLAEYGEIAIYPKVLCSYYEEEEQSRIKKYLRYNFVEKLEKIMLNNFKKLDLNPSKNELSLVREFLRNNKKLKKEDANLVLNFFKNAIASNKKIKLYNANSFKAICIFQLIRLMKLNYTKIPAVLIYLILNPVLILPILQSRPKYSIKL